MSPSIALRRSLKPGALTATDLKVPRILLTIRVASASPAMSSAMISSGLPDCMTFSRTGRRSRTAEIFDPHLFLVDKEPLGLRGEARDTLVMLKERGTRLVLGLRDVRSDGGLAGEIEAMGRRVLALAPARQPAYAGVVTGSFVTSQTQAAAAGPDIAASPSPLSRVALWFALGGFAALVASLAIRGVIVGRGPWGNLYEFSAAFATSIVGGYLLLQRRYPIRSIGFIPVGVAFALLLYASSLP